MGQAKLRKNEIAALKANGNRKLLAAYWGYHPVAKFPNITNKPGEYTDSNQGGFEFSSTTLEASGLPKSLVMQVIRHIYDVVQYQNNGLKNGAQDVLEGLTVQEFVDQEQMRLDNVVKQLDVERLINRSIPTEQYITYAVVACCAISTLVAYGRLKQDEFNGDRYIWG